MPEPSDSARDALATAQIEADVGVEHIASVYAQALLDAALSGGPAAVADAVEELDAVVAELLDRFPKFDAVLASALVSPEEKSAVIERTLAGRVTPLVVHFLKVVAHHGRLDCLRAIRRQVHALWDRRRNRIRVEFTTAAPVSPEMARQVVESIRAKLGGEPVLEQKTDPELIGGAVLKIGDVVYDGSIANQLRNLRQMSTKGAPMKFKADEIASVIQQEIEHFESRIDVREVGRVIELGDGIARSTGFPSVMSGEMVEFPGGAFGLAFNLEENSVGVIILGDYLSINEGDEVRGTGRLLSVPVGDGVLGRVIDPLGNPLDGGGPIVTSERRRSNRRPPAWPAASRSRCRCRRASRPSTR